MNLFPRKNIHLDYAATTPLCSEAFSVMKPYFSEKFYNPATLYDGGISTHTAVEESRGSVARYLGCRLEEVIFTGGGTEATNLAIRGVLQALWTKDPQRKAHIVTSSFEHPATLELCRFLEKKGWIEVTYVNPSPNGMIQEEDIKSALREDTILVSIIHVHNEVGTVQPIRNISRVIQAHKKESKSSYPYLHTDSSQAPCFVKVHKESLGVDLITLDSAKFYGPKGVGVLFVKGGVEIEAVQYGGGQENGLRPGTENVPGIVGFAKSLQVAEKLREPETERLRTLNLYFVQKIKKYIKGSIIHGEEECKTPHILNVCFPKIDSEFLTIQLASKGVSVSFMTACKTSGDSNESHSIAVMSPDCASSSVRFSFGRRTGKSELKKVVEILREILK